MLMDVMKEELIKLFESVEAGQKRLAEDCIDDYVFFVEQTNYLKTLPQIRVNKKNPAIQERTPASRMIKENAQTLTNLRKTLLMILYRSASGGEGSALEKLLAEFEKM